MALTNLTKPFQKERTIILGLENHLSTIAASHDVVDGPRINKAKRTIVPRLARETNGCSGSASLSRWIFWSRSFLLQKLLHQNEGNVRGKILHSLKRMVRMGGGLSSAAYAIRVCYSGLTPEFGCESLNELRRHYCSAR